MYGDLTLSQNSPKFKPGDLICWKNKLNNNITVAKIISVNDSHNYTYEVIYPIEFTEVFNMICYIFESETTVETEPQILTNKQKLELL